MRLERLGSDLGIELFAKLEGLNPGGSVKDRIALAMIEDAEQRGVLRPGSTIIEPTSGNTGIALAMVSAARRYRVVLTMPEDMSEERRALLRSYGAELVLTPGALMRAAVEQAELLGQTTPGAVLLRQFDNPANPRAHELTTAEEMWRDSDGLLDVLVAGVGTGGTLTGIARVWKKRRPAFRAIAVEPAAAAVLSGKAPTHHRIQGIGAGFVPGVLDRSLIDEVIAVDEDEALEASRRLARQEGLLVGISSGAALAAVIKLAARPDSQGRRVGVVLPDLGERYISTPYFRELSR